MWGWERHAAVVLSVASLAVVYFLLGFFLTALLGKLRLWKWGVRHLFAAALLVILVRTTVGLLMAWEVLPVGVERFLNRGTIKLGYYFALPAIVVLGAPRHSLVFVGRLYRRVLFPLALVLLVLPVLFPRNWVQNRLTPRAIEKQFGGQKIDSLANVYMVLFDGWPYTHLFKDGEVSEELPNLREFVKSATVYHDAYSPAPRSHVSISRFLFQDDADYQAQDFYTVWHRVVETRETGLGTSIFSAADGRWAKIVVGNALEYDRILGDEVDAAVMFNQVFFRGIVKEAVSILWSQLQWFRYAGINVRPNAYDPKRFWESEVWIDKNEEIHRVAESVIKNIDRPTFAMFHYCLPHYPFLYERDGRLPSVPDDPDRIGDMALFMGNLRYADTVLGELVATLKEAGKYDNSYIMFFADHTWRWDPAIRNYRIMNADDIAEAEANPRHFWKRVPVVIKHPGQTARADVLETFFTARLLPDIEASLEPADVHE